MNILLHRNLRNKDLIFLYQIPAPYFTKHGAIWWKNLFCSLLISIHSQPFIVAAYIAPGIPQTYMCSILSIIFEGRISMIKWLLFFQKRDARFSNNNGGCIFYEKLSVRFLTKCYHKNVAGCGCQAAITQLLPGVKQWITLAYEILGLLNEKYFHKHLTRHAFSKKKAAIFYMNMESLSHRKSMLSIDQVKDRDQF